MLVPAPFQVIFHRSRNAVLYAYTNFSLTCLISPNTTRVDTDFAVENVVTGPGTLHLDRVSVSKPLPVAGGKYEIVVSFRHLLEEDRGSYSCSAMIVSLQTNVVSSDSRSISNSIEVRGQKIYLLYSYI